MSNVVQVHWVIGRTHQMTTKKLKLVNLLKTKIDEVRALKLINAAFSKSHDLRESAIATIRHLLTKGN
jgi:predicted small secreted protein